MESSYVSVDNARAEYQHEDSDQSDDSPEGDLDTEYNAESSTVDHGLWSTTAKKRGRHAKDPNAQQVRFDCKDVEDLEEKLREYLKDPIISAERATIEFHFPASSAFMVYTRDYKRDGHAPWTPYDVPDLLRRTAVSVYDVMQPSGSGNEKEDIIRSKAVARVCIEAIQRADGFKYSFHNNWLSREDKAHRFSFFCNDSTLNKGRAAGGGYKGSGKTAKKPIYECNGLITVKFSVTKNNLEVHYRHIPVHKTYAERAPPPRPESKRYRLLELLNPQALEALKPPPRKRTKTAEGGTRRTGGTSKRRGRPRKPRDNEQPEAPTGLEKARDDGLQPLIDFIERAESLVQDEADAEVNNSDSLVVIQANNVPATVDVNTNTSDKQNDKVQKQSGANGGTRRGRKRKAGPGEQTTDPIEPKELTWGNTETPRSYERVLKGVPEPQRPAETPTEPLSEIEFLKKKLLEAEQRIQKLEAAAIAPHPPYPPYSPYPHPNPYAYPYPHPPPSHGYPPYTPTTPARSPVPVYAPTSRSTGSMAPPPPPSPLAVQYPEGVTTSATPTTRSNTAKASHVGEASSKTPQANTPRSTTQSQVVQTPTITRTTVITDPPSTSANAQSSASVDTASSPISPNPTRPHPQNFYTYQQPRTSIHLDAPNPSVQSPDMSGAQIPLTPIYGQAPYVSPYVPVPIGNHPPRASSSVSTNKRAAAAAVTPRPNVPTKDPPVHYVPVSNITNSSWAPVVSTKPARASPSPRSNTRFAQHTNQWPHWLPPTTQPQALSYAGQAPLGSAPGDSSQSADHGGGETSILAGIHEAAGTRNDTTQEQGQNQPVAQEREGVENTQTEATVVDTTAKEGGKDTPRNRRDEEEDVSN